MATSYKVIIRKGCNTYTASRKFTTNKKTLKFADGNEPNSTTIDCLEEKLSGLDIKAPVVTSNTNQNEINIKIPAGKINKIITNLKIVLIEPLSVSDLLYIDTLLYIQPQHKDNISNANYIPLGYIDDIFGTVSKPMYSVNIIQDLTDLNVGDQVYYLPSHPCTQHMHVKRAVS